MATTIATIDPQAEFETPIPSGAAWYAAYTCPRHEKSVARQLEDRGVDSFLPTYRSLHRWKDRRKEVEQPLFPSYVFVRVVRDERTRILQLPGIVRFVSFNGRPAELAEIEISALRNGLRERMLIEPHPYLRVGRRVRITHGPLAGANGILLRKKDQYRVVLSVDLIMRSVAVEVDIADLRPM